MEGKILNENIKTLNKNIKTLNENIKTLNENIKTLNENIIIKNNNNIFTIEFKYTSYSLIKSLIKTRIIQGGSTDEFYKTITFKAESVKTMKEYTNECGNLSISEIAKMIRTLTKQLDYLIHKESSTIIGYNMNDIIIINDEKFAFLGSELIAKIDPFDKEMATISCPFSTKDFFVSPELLKIKEIPSLIHFKTSYFSFACLIISSLLGNDEFYIDYLKNRNHEKILHVLNNHPIKNTRIYWLLSRCLVEEEKNRSIILI
jgi:hypothetical protein